jgi:hypothetical protein
MFSSLTATRLDPIQRRRFGDPIKERTVTRTSDTRQPVHSEDVARRGISTGPDTIRCARASADADPRRRQRTIKRLVTAPVIGETELALAASLAAGSAGAGDAPPSHRPITRPPPPAAALTGTGSSPSSGSIPRAASSGCTRSGPAARDCGPSRCRTGRRMGAASPSPASSQASAATCSSFGRAGPASAT